MRTIIQCPGCNEDIDVGHELEEAYKERFEIKLGLELEKKLLVERKKLEPKLKKEFEEANTEKLRNFQRLLKESSKKTKSIQFESEMKILQLQKMLDDQKKLTEQMKKKQNQIPQKIQGEALEQSLEDWLGKTFPNDKVIPVKNGERGADCFFEIIEGGKICGRIIIECKNTKSFQERWISKHKADLSQSEAVIGIIVTEVLPKKMDRFGVRDGIVVCTYDDFKGMIHILRTQVVLLFNSTLSNQNKDSKVERLYNYLTSTKFRQQFEIILDSYKEMKDQLDKEKKVQLSSWKIREKQIENLASTTHGIYGSIKGIAGNALPEFDLINFSPDADEF